MTDWPLQVTRLTAKALSALGDPIRADDQANYMKHVAPFLGIATPERRMATKQAWKALPIPSSDELGEAALQLFMKPEREFHYAACDLIHKYIDSADETFLAEYLEQLLTTKSWWDTVDALVNAGVSPLCWRFDATEIIDQWSESQNRWLIRAAIGHQRGWKSNTDIDQILHICDRHWEDSEFFIAKAIGWALRDITAVDSQSVRRFLTAHPIKNSVAEREAIRGLKRA
jgi:3-methyladenine DNA glycosylase AlkD